MLAIKTDGKWIPWNGINSPMTKMVSTMLVTYADGRQAELACEPYPVEVLLTAAIVEALWGDAELEEFGIRRVAPFELPDGKVVVDGTFRLVEADGGVRIDYEIQDAPPAPAPPPEPTAEERLAAAAGLTVEELHAVLGRPS